jgi:hypothetical protein
MKLYSGIDLHSNNSVVVVIDEQDRVSTSGDIPTISGPL